MNEREQKFVKSFIENGGNATKAALEAGYPQNSARQRGYELVKNNQEVIDAIKNADKVQAAALSDVAITPDSIFETNITKAIETMASQTSDPDGAKKFFEAYVKHSARKEEKLGEYANLSTAELIRECDKYIKELTDVKQRMLEAVRTGEMQNGPDILS